ALDRRRRDREGRARPGVDVLSLHALPVPPGGIVRRQDARRAPQCLRGPRGEEGVARGRPHGGRDRAEPPHGRAVGASDPAAVYARSLFYAPGSFADPQAYAELKRRLEKIETEFGIPGNRVFYLSIPPSLIATCVDQLQAAGLVAEPREGPISRIIVEKPVG